jgi:hypothetical protein
MNPVFMEKSVRFALWATRAFLEGFKDICRARG